MGAETPSKDSQSELPAAPVEVARGGLARPHEKPSDTTEPARRWQRWPETWVFLTAAGGTLTASGAYLFLLGYAYEKGQGLAIGLPAEVPDLPAGMAKGFLTILVALQVNLAETLVLFSATVTAVWFFFRKRQSSDDDAKPAPGRKRTKLTAEVRRRVALPKWPWLSLGKRLAKVWLATAFLIVWCLISTHLALQTGRKHAENSLTRLEAFYSKGCEASHPQIQVTYSRQRLRATGYAYTATENFLVLVSRDGTIAIPRRDIRFATRIPCPAASRNDG